MVSRPNSTAEEIRVTLPNGIVFNLSRGLDPSGSIVANIPSDGPDADEFSVFVPRNGIRAALWRSAPDKKVPSQRRT